MNLNINLGADWVDDDERPKSTLRIGGYTAVIQFVTVTDRYSAVVTDGWTGKGRMVLFDNYRDEADARDACEEKIRDLIIAKLSPGGVVAG